MNDLTKKIYTLTEANNMIPSFEIAFRRIFQMNHQISLLLHQLKLNKIDPNIIYINKNHDYDEETIDAITSIKVLLSTIQKEVDYLQEQAIEVKNIEKGLVSLTSKIGKKEITLCWKVGEPQISQWHDKGNNKKPIAELTDYLSKNQ